jgi:hypothetical protein
LVAARRRATRDRRETFAVNFPQFAAGYRQSCDLILFASSRQMGRAATCTATDIQLTFRYIPDPASCISGSLNVDNEIVMLATSA